MEDRRKNGSVSIDYRWCHAQVVPTEKVLKQFLEVGNTYSVITKYIEEESGETESLNIFNGTLWKNIQAKFNNKICLPLLMYFDDFECGNPLGTQAGIH